MNLKKTIFKVLLVISLALSVISILLPWLWEKGRSPLAIYPPITSSSRFWSYQAVVNVFSGTHLTNSFVLRFQEYWIPSTLHAYPLNIYLGWFFVFVFQIIGIVAGATSTVKETVKGKPLPLILTITCSILSLILCCFQLFKQSAPGRGLVGLSVNFDIGFFIALISTVLWTVPLWIDKLMKRKTMSLILLLIASAIPTVLFIIGLVAILRFHIQMGGGNLWFDWNRQLIGVTSRGAGTAMYIPNFILGLISIPIFSASILYLYREWQSRNMQKRAL